MTPRVASLYEKICTFVSEKDFKSANKLLYEDTEVRTLDLLLGSKDHRVLVLLNTLERNAPKSICKRTKAFSESMVHLPYLQIRVLMHE